MARGTGTVTVKFLGDTTDLKKASDDADSALGKVGSSVAGMAKTAAMVGIPALVGFGAAAVKAFAESEQVSAQTEAVLKSTGGAAKVTAGHIGDLAGSLANMSGVDDEVIQSGENMLLTFTNIRNGVSKSDDVFDQATKTMLDMSVALGQDTKQSAMQLGKALNDPVKGVGALSRVGVKFTAEQKDQIATLVESGKTMEAQKIILKELQVEFGGSAKAAGETFGGQLNRLKVMAGNFMEEVGGKLIPVIMKLASVFTETVIPAVSMVLNAFRNLFSGYEDSANGFAEEFDELFGGNGKFIGTFRAVGEFILNTIDTIKNVFKGGTSAISDESGQISTIIGQLRDTFSSAFGAIQAIVITAVDFLRGFWRVFGDDLKSFTREAWASIQETFRGAFNFISGFFDLIKAVLTGKWGDAWEAVKKIFDGAWDTIFALMRHAVTNVIPTILAGIGQAVTSIARTAFDGLKDAFKNAINWVIDRWNGLDFKIGGWKVGTGPLSVTLPEVTAGLPHIPRLAKGGTFSGAAIVGEAGPELLVGSGRIIPNNRLGGGVTINFYGPQDRAGVAREIEGILTDFVRNGGNLRFT